MTEVALINVGTRFLRDLTNLLNIYYSHYCLLISKEIGNDALNNPNKQKIFTKFKQKLKVKTNLFH